MKNLAILQYMLRAFCQIDSPSGFEKVFGGDADHLWDKYARVYKQNLVDFVCSLDVANSHKLQRFLCRGTDNPAQLKNALYDLRDKACEQESDEQCYCDLDYECLIHATLGQTEFLTEE